VPSRFVTTLCLVLVSSSAWAPATYGDANVAAAAAGPSTGSNVNLDVHDFRVVSSASGPVDYYQIIQDPSGPVIRSAYVPPYQTAVLGYQFPDDYRRRVARIRWKWRALTLPNQGNECVKGSGDSAAVVYVTWKRGLKWYTLKYVWSAVAPKGMTCDAKRSIFRAQDTVIVESGSPLNEWRTYEIDPDQEFRAHFEHGDPRADVPKLLGLGIMSDGDQTKSSSSADFGGFSLTLR
jgi:hypothetical protein